MRSRPNPASRAALGLLLCGVFAQPIWAQVHKVTSPQKVVRAVGVYEWTGDLAKPTGARLIPVSLFIDGRLVDADVYQSNPVPFALDTGNVYELQKAGLGQGTLAVAFARKLVPTTTATTAWDDGWFGYGKVLPPAAPKKSNLKPITTPIKINAIDEANDDRPHFSSRSATPGSGGSAAPAPGTGPAASSTPAADPDRPTLHRGSGADGDNAGAGIPDDPDRPTLKKHASAPAGTATNEDVTAIGSPMADTNRPTLHRGRPEGSFTEADLPKLIGLPGDHDLEQMVAVSDAADRQPHDFSRAWDDDTERATVLGKMQNAARVALTAYEQANNLVPTSAAPAVDSAPVLKRAPAPATHRAGAKKPLPAPPAPEPLTDEKLAGYLLSYGGSPTFVYSAHTDGTGAAERFVTIVAQENPQGEPEIALKSVTDAAHLDRAPRMRLVDAVDAEASNRASLLFELRAQNSRQFALYRVIGGRSDQSFLTGATQ